ncbi:MAG TPA: alkaline phosphatase family protein, partial [Flavobacterium sp.]
MIKFISLILLLLCVSVNAQRVKGPKISKIAFGSCADQNTPLPIFDVVASHKPDMFIFLGDNIYADTDNIKEFQKKYDMLGAKPSYKNMKRAVPHILATWDDHDYGKNDEGKDFEI